MQDSKSGRKQTKRLLASLLGIALGSITLLIVYFLFSSYSQRIELSKKKEFEKLEATVNALSLFIDGDMHNDLMNNFREKDAIKSNTDHPIYERIRNQMNTVRKANGITVDVYTLIKYDGDELTPEHATCFGVTTSETPYFRHGYQPPQEMLDVFNVGGKIGPYGDTHGTWLSAVAPIFDSNREVVGVVEADVQFDRFIEEARAAFMDELFKLLGVFVVVILLVWFFIRRISKVLMGMQYEISTSYTKLNNTFDTVTHFARQIERGNLDAEIKLTSEDSNLVQSLNSMRESLLEVRRDEERKAWVNEGVETIGKALRLEESNLTMHAQQILSSIARYLRLPMGVLYILNDNNEDNFLVPIANVGFGDRFQHKQFGLNEGLIGRVFQEKETITVEAVPEEYFEIASGTGKLKPKSILMLPLMINNQVEGALELVSLEPLNEAQLELLSKISGRITSTLFQRKTNIRTLQLLETSRKLNAETNKANAELNVMRDEAIKSKEEALKLKEMAEKASKVKSEFLANMSHELRTPLNGVIGYAQILMEDPGLSDKYRSKIRVIDSSGKHLLGLINNVLDISKVEAGRQELHNSEFELRPWADEIVTMLKLRAQQKNLSLQLNFDNRLPAFIHSDSGKLRQCILNLLGNAIKFTDEGGVVLDIRYEPNNRVGFYVIDSGRGIPQDRIDTILEPFSQIHDHGVNEGGTGLGLTITRDFAKLLGGELKIESQINKGSTFSFSIELVEVEIAQAYHADTTRRIAGIAGTHQPTILIVDDIKVNRDVAKEVLLQAGFTCLEAEDGQQGMELVASKQPDLVLSDIRMPVMDGFEFIAALRAQDSTKTLPVVAMTASAENVGAIRDLSLWFR